MQLRFEGDETLTLRADPYTGPTAYAVPNAASVGGTIFPGSQSANGAVVFLGTGQNGVVNLSAPPKSVSGNWDCTKVKLTSS